MTLLRKPYRDGRNAIQFDGVLWVVALCFPWWVGMVEIVKWVLS